MRAPNGAWTTSCMPPDSSKKRSKTTSRVGGDEAEAVAGGAQVVDELARAEVIEAALLLEALAEAARCRRARLRPRAEAADLLGQLDGAAGGLAEPEGDGGRRAVGVLDAHLACSTRLMRQEVLPSRKMSPVMLSMAKSSFTVPTKVSSGSAMTR